MSTADTLHKKKKRLNIKSSMMKMKLKIQGIELDIEKKAFKEFKESIEKIANKIH